MNEDTKWLIFGLVFVIVIAILIGYINHTVTSNNTERDRIRIDAGLNGPYKGTCLWNAAADRMVLTCEFELDPSEIK